MENWQTKYSWSTIPKTAQYRILIRGIQYIYLYPYIYFTDSRNNNWTKFIQYSFDNRKPFNWKIDKKNPNYRKIPKRIKKELRMIQFFAMSSNIELEFSEQASQWYIRKKTYDGGEPRKNLWNKREAVNTFSYLKFVKLNSQLKLNISELMIVILLRLTNMSYRIVSIISVWMFVKGFCSNEGHR